MGTNNIPNNIKTITYQESRVSGKAKTVKYAKEVVTKRNYAKSLKKLEALNRNIVKNCKI